jgi:hypothetical protein
MKHHEHVATGQQIFGETVKPSIPHTVRDLTLDHLAARRGIADALGRAFAGTRTSGRTLPFWLQRRRFTQISETASPRKGAIQRA